MGNNSVASKGKEGFREGNHSCEGVAYHAGIAVTTGQARLKACALKAGNSGVLGHESRHPPDMMLYQFCCSMSLPFTTFPHSTVKCLRLGRAFMGL